MSLANETKIIADRINRRLKALGMSARAASLAATGSPDTIRYIATRGVVPSSTNLMALCRVLKTNPLYLMGHDDETLEGDTDLAEDRSLFFRTAHRENEAKRSVPLYITKHNGTATFEDENGGAVNVITFGITAEVRDYAFPPVGMAEKEVGGLIMPLGDRSMEPAISSGEPLLYYRNSVVRRARYALLELTNQQFVIRYVEWSDNDLLLVRQWDPQLLVRIPRKAVVSAEVILRAPDYL